MGAEKKENGSKRVPIAGVFTVDVHKGTEGANILGFIEGHIAITRVNLIVTKAFNGTTPSITVTDLAGGLTETYFTNASLSAEVVVTSPLFVPVAGTIEPLYTFGKSQWDCLLTLGASTEGEAKIVVEYVQIETEPGLHSPTPE